MKTLIIILLTFSLYVHAKPNQTISEKQLIERGRYIVKTTGCNDCHTPLYGPKNGEVSEKDWLIGDGVGWKGPWGTTYPVNIRQRLSQMTEDQWITYAKNMKSRPPMPWFSVNAMNDRDLRAMYYFIRWLGDSSNSVPEGLPPGQVPKTPYMNMTVIVPLAAEHPK